MWTRFAQFESLEHLLATRLRPGGDGTPTRCVVFGGTGAVGGAVVLELIRLILVSRLYRDQPLTGQIYATAMSDHEISQFMQRVFMALEPEAPIEKRIPLREYRLGGQVDLRFATLQLRAPEGLPEYVARRIGELGAAEPDIETLLREYCAQLPSPFLDFVEHIHSGQLLDGVVVGIPLPSVATYTLDSMDAVAERYRLDRDALTRVKDFYLATFVRGLAVTRQKYARHVIMAHTTGVGGMYTVDEVEPEIRLGFAHSAKGRQLVEKKHFADELTRLYLDQALEVLVTAAAIGIDAVEFNLRLPLIHPVRRGFAAALNGLAEPPVPPEEVAEGFIRLYPPLNLPFDRPSEPPAGAGGEGEAGKPVRFAASRELFVEAAIRSGENGLFSVANCTALYHVMKVAIPEELAMVIIRRLVFGRERRRGWFSEGLCYYTETENAHFAHRVLDSDQRLVRAHLGAFAVQAYQALGSSTHQARLHELGLIVLLLRLLDLKRRFESFSDQQLMDGSKDLDEFLWQHTGYPCFEDFLALGPQRLAELLGGLCEVKNRFHMGEWLGYDLRSHGQRPPGHERFLSRLCTRVRRYLSTITSLGTPIVFQSSASGSPRVLLGPYVAPLDTVLTRDDDLERILRRQAADSGVTYQVARDWVVANNGFIDLRPHALGTDAKELTPATGTTLLATTDREELHSWLAGRTPSGYFTTSGLLALDYRLRCLWHRLQTRHTELGTANTWKNLFFRLADGRYVLAPGLVETVRMYCEGLGKVTGTELLWPRWGYWSGGPDPGA